MKVYIVTSGAYSDYRIETVFLTEEKANLYVKLHRHEDGWNDMCVNEFETQDENLIGSVDDVLYFYEYKVDDGQLKSRFITPRSPYAFTDNHEGLMQFAEYLDDNSYVVADESSYFCETKDNGDYFGVVVKEDDPNKAFKIATDKWFVYLWHLVEMGKYVPSFRKQDVKSDNSVNCAPSSINCPTSSLNLNCAFSTHSVGVK